MPINATVTAKTGPNSQVTALALPGLSSMVVSPDRKVLQLFNENSPVPSKEFDLTGVTTFTVAVSGNTWTLTVS